MAEPTLTTSNPYETPRAVLADLPDADSTSVLPFFPVAVWKLGLMSLSTLGVYLLYWHYKQWKAVKAGSNEDLWPIPRAFFYPLTGWDLFPRIALAGRAVDVPVLWAPWVIAAIVLLLNLVAWVANIANITWLGFIGLLQLVPHAFVQDTINRTLAITHPEAPRNDRPTALNIIWLILSGLFWGLVLLGTLVQSASR